WRDFFSAVLFGSAAFRRLIPPISLAITGLGLHVIIYGYFRGQLNMWKANCLQFVNGGLIPPLALAVSGRSAAQAITWMAAGWIGSSSSWAIVELWNQEARQATKNDVITSVRELLAYGLPRVPGEFFLFGLFTVPTLIVARSAGIEAAGSLSLGFS